MSRHDGRVIVWWIGRLALVAALLLPTACGDDESGVAGPSSSCLMGPYTFDSNPNVNRCRASNGQFAANACCGR
jgi:hypothetical protein